MIKLILFPVVAILLVTVGLVAFFVFVRKDEKGAVRVAESGAEMIARYGMAAAKALTVLGVVCLLIVGAIAAKLSGFF